MNSSFYKKILIAGGFGMISIYALKNFLNETKN